MEQNNIVDISAVEAKIVYQFRNKELLMRALTHASYSNEHNCESYERLEFIGDATLGYVIGLYLYETFPLFDEGKLTKLRAGIVDRKTISEVFDSLDIIMFVRAGKGTAPTDLASSIKVKCDVFEAIIGAIVIDNDNDPTSAKEFILKFLSNKISSAKVDYKSKFLELCVKTGLKSEFIVKNIGKDSTETQFKVIIKIDGKDACCGLGHNIKSAEQDACKNYFNNF